MTKDGVIRGCGRVAVALILLAGSSARAGESVEEAIDQGEKAASHHRGNKTFGFDRCVPSCYRSSREELSDDPARALNMVHYRLAEAQRAKRKNNTNVCIQAGMESSLLSLGLVAFREQMEAKHRWKKREAHETRWDGKLAEAELFRKTEQMGSEAKALATACIGSGVPPLPSDYESMKFWFIVGNCHTKPDLCGLPLAAEFDAAPAGPSGGGGKRKKDCLASDALCDEDGQCCSRSCSGQRTVNDVDHWTCD